MFCYQTVGNENRVVTKLELTKARLSLLSDNVSCRELHSNCMPKELKFKWKNTLCMAEQRARFDSENRTELRQFL